ncbi:MAG: TonB-dependent receptor [Acidimicrobiia bacterium]
MSMHQGSLARIAVAIACAAGATPVMAQQQPGSLEEIVVTARKREESLLVAPVAVSVVTPQIIEDVGALRISDIGARLPNVSTLAGPAALTGSGFSPFIRGISTGARGIGFDSGFGIFINGAYAGRNETSNKFLPDLERVEFLPGPQATLFGKNTTVGVLNLVTRKPGDAWEGSATASMGNDGHEELTIDARGPVADGWGIAASAGLRKYDGIYTNYIPASRAQYDPQGIYNGRVGPTLDAKGGSLELTYSGDTSADLYLDYYESDRENNIGFGRIEGFDALPLDVRESATMPTSTAREWGGILNLSHTLGGGTLTSVTAYRDSHSDTPFDDDGYAIPLQEIGAWITDSEHVSEELRLAGNAGLVNYLVGAYGPQQDTTTYRSGNVLGLIPNFHITGEVEAETIAAFANVDFDITEAFGAEIGVRWQDERKDMPYYTQSGGTRLGVIEFSTSDSRQVDNVSYTAALTYAFTDRIHSHFRYSRGFKSGGYAVDFMLSPFLTPLEFGDESADHFELGLKAELADRWSVNAGLFLTDYHDLQVSEFTRVPGQALPVVTTKNSGESRTDGIEVSIVYGGENLTLNGSIGTANARYTNWNRQTATGFEDMSGVKFPSPDLTVNMLANYRIPLGTGNLHLIGESIYRSDTPAAVGVPKGPIIPTDPASPLRPDYVGDAITVVNFRARYDIGAHWSVTAWVNNAFDSRDVTNRRPNNAEGYFEAFRIFTASQIRQQVAGDLQAPRQYGVDVRYQFGGK